MAGRSSPSAAPPDAKLAAVAPGKYCGVPNRLPRERATWALATAAAAEGMGNGGAGSFDRDAVLLALLDVDEKSLSFRLVLSGGAVGAEEDGS